ncbi:hypothetical protein PNK_2445 [Candidatus Protochlamydia naegleriophila]|uniref:Uncharacterized protein n=1 Tax=Candidatus Protochlamydia naegleriophila TaxID=389348 RepID=A0A0U5JFS3_9BACT|nr:hypothetical protein [Candidatus Protochlamydia naegleriophila]CUI18039.1 hypothetical protein PNK_2445 [Candidatus Protochlamydia naegleriophila]
MQTALRNNCKNSKINSQFAKILRNCVGWWGFDNYKAGLSGRIIEKDYYFNLPPNLSKRVAGMAIINILLNKKSPENAGELQILGQFQNSQVKQKAQ